jgi:hypothetical protein
MNQDLDLKPPRRMASRLSPQNILIMHGYRRACEVLQALGIQNLTVVEVTIDSDRPRIQLLEAPTPEQLTSESQHVRFTDDGRRWIEHKAIVNHCAIFWRVPLTH